ncbi:MAG: elongation factor Ts [Gammaproteobacteria bacterium]|nr:elongation factor Ts [Gammaproteobacteria bacterium]
MAITAAQVKALRERTGSGMMECKKALVETGGDIEAAIELMRKTGLAKADKKAGRVAAEGKVVICFSSDNKKGVLIEVNCETDFVTKGDDFNSFADQLAQRALAGSPADLDALLELSFEEGGSQSINEARQALIVKIGENINVRRFASLESSDGMVAGYSHGNSIGVIVSLTGGDAVLARDVAMHVAASRPVAISADDVAAETIAKEKEIYVAQAAESGKPAEIIEKMVSGRLRKFLSEITLLGQSFIKDPDVTVEKLLGRSNAQVAGFVRFEVGEGIEKKEENFAEEVMAQVSGS